MNLFKQPDLESYYNDERIKYEQYRAGYYAFITVAVLFLSLGAVALFFWEDEIPVWIAASAATAILMVGFWIVIIMSWRAGLFEAWREMVNRKPKMRRRMLMVNLLQALWFAVWMGLFDYFFNAGSPSVLRSVIFGTANGAWFGAWMYWWQLRKIRKAEKEGGSQV